MTKKITLIFFWLIVPIISFAQEKVFELETGLSGMMEILPIVNTSGEKDELGLFLISQSDVKCAQIDNEFNLVQRKFRPIPRQIGTLQGYSVDETGYL